MILGNSENNPPPSLNAIVKALFKFPVGYRE